MCFIGPRVFSCLALLLGCLPVVAQPGHDLPEATVDPALYEGLAYRLIGPFRGGRSTAVDGLAGRPGVYVMGTTGGGVWKTDDYGHTWHNLSDGFFGGSIGAIDVADSDPAVIYVGTGSACIRGNTSAGHGLWKSTDGGRSWAFSGLPEAGQIGDVVVHPTNADLVYVAALGHAFGKNPERGVFRSRDGGATWEHVLAIDDSTGVVSLAMNPHNPREIYAGAWRAERKPWTLLSGGPNGGVYKTTDGGNTWTKLAGGLPTGLVGKVGVAVSPANPDRVWALIEAEPDGGLYRSDDAGKTWTRINHENKLRQRAWYYTHVVADPQDEHTVYVLNVAFHRSVDGGKTFEAISVPHGDTHDLWIDPNDPKTMVLADDGGAQVTVNGGKTWSTYYNQPTAELYGVVVDNQIPYRVYGAQQDNTAISLPAWTSSNTLHPKSTWTNPGGCETGPVALHPDHPEITWGGCYGGAINRVDHRTGQYRNVILYPQLQLGEAGKNLRHRFQWVAPIVVSPHDPNVVYHGSQFVNRTTDGGMTWETISPDLTTNTPAHQDYSGGPINHDITGVEIFNTLFSLAVSPHDPEVIWAGSDDGLIHVTRNGGADWRNVTPPGMPRFGTVNSIEVSPHAAGEVFVAVQRYRLDDFAPYVFHTTDYGRTWRSLAGGLPEGYPVRVVRQDPVDPDLLFAGTEFGLFVSFDRGAHWQSLQLNLPLTPVTDLRIAHDDLILSTQGRSFWVLDDVTPLRQIDAQVAAADVHLFAPRAAMRVNDRGGSDEHVPGPKARPSGALLHYYLAEPAEEVTIQILDAEGRIARSFSSDSSTARREATAVLDTTAGMHRLTWDLRYTPPHLLEEAVVWGYTGGVKAPPGTYEVRLIARGQTRTQPLTVRPDPRLTDVTDEDYAAQFALAMQVRDAIDAIHDALRTIRSLYAQLDYVTERARQVGAVASFEERAASLRARLQEIETQLTQTRNKSNQDPIRFPPKLDNQFIELYNNVTGPDGYIAGGAEGRPTAGAYERFEDLSAQWTAIRNQLDTLLASDLKAVNAAFEQLNLAPLSVPPPQE